MAVKPIFIGATHAVGPRAYLEDHPTQQSIKLGGRYINIKRLAKEHGLNHSYLSRIVSGERLPSVEYGKKVAGALGMGYEEFLTACEQRGRELHEKAERQLRYA